MRVPGTVWRECVRYGESTAPSRPSAFRHGLSRHPRIPAPLGIPIWKLSEQHRVRRSPRLRAEAACRARGNRNPGGFRVGGGWGLGPSEGGSPALVRTSLARGLGGGRALCLPAFPVTVTIGRDSQQGRLLLAAELASVSRGSEGPGLQPRWVCWGWGAPGPLVRSARLGFQRPRFSRGRARLRQRPPRSQSTIKSRVGTLGHRGGRIAPQPR